jgi:hypothetical protein
MIPRTTGAKEHERFPDVSLEAVRRMGQGNRVNAPFRRHFNPESSSGLE